MWRGLSLEELLECARVPHVLCGQGGVSLAVPVARLDGVVTEVDSLLQVTECELLRAEPQVTLPETHTHTHTWVLLQTQTGTHNYNHVWCWSTGRSK